MNKDYPFAELRQRIENTQKIPIVLPAKPNFDQVAAALSLSLALEGAGRTSPVVCQMPMTVEFNRLVGVNKISDKVQGTDLIISLNYPVEQIEKVSYNDDNNRPNVVVQPKAGAPPLSESQAAFSYAGGGADLFITIGLKDPSQVNISGLNLGNSFLVNLDADPNNTQFGQLNIVDFEAASVCEVILNLILGFGLSLSVDAAQNLLSGIWRQTQGLTSPLVGADTYEAVAVCLRNGAQRPLESPFKKEEFYAPKAKFEPRPSPAPVKEVARPAEGQKPVEDKKASESKEEKGAQKPPADWFEPKIFKGTNFTS